MRYEISFQGSGVVEVSASGEASVGDLNRLDTEIVEDPRWVPGMRVLFDFRELDLAALSSQDTRESSDFVRKLSDRFGSARFACVMTREVDFGIGRMFETLTSDDTKLDIAIFRSLSDAREWLASDDPE